ncbi:hypothetical protein BGZ76_000697 [Entomortierella beljakovae]|nr:hypothetical protein BGZ76_000697 [Entomortierella beljakovae]
MAESSATSSASLSRTVRHEAGVPPKLQNHPSIAVNKIKQFMDAHYISACKSVWCILGLKIYDQKPSVMSLHLHLRGHHMVVFNEDAPMEVIAQKISDDHCEHLTFSNLLVQNN